jgi:SAM-dependent methyltransferase
MLRVERSAGQRVFGDDPANYHAARPDYPDWVFETMRERCGLRPGCVAFDVGAGTGKATQGLLEAGADRVVAVEPDPRLAAFLRRNNPDPALRVVNEPFETAQLGEAGFDLGICATAFHWLDEPLALSKVAQLLRPGGWWVMVWNIFGDTGRPDPFHDATWRLLDGEQTPAAGPVPFGLDEDARTTAMLMTGAFEEIDYFGGAWDLELNPDQVAALYATYSNVAIRPDRDHVLSELRRIAAEDFGGRVRRNMITSFFMARRR